MFFTDLDLGQSFTVLIILSFIQKPAMIPHSQEISFLFDENIIFSG